MLIFQLCACEVLIVFEILNFWDLCLLWKKVSYICSIITNFDLWHNCERHPPIKSALVHLVVGSISGRNLCEIYTFGKLKTTVT